MKRTTIDNNERSTSFSKRAAKGDLDVVKVNCPYCGHTKMFHHMPYNAKHRYKCTKCKAVLDG